MQCSYPTWCYHLLPGYSFYTLGVPSFSLRVQCLYPMWCHYLLSGCRSCTLRVHLLYPSGATPDTRGALLYSRGAITYLQWGVCNYCTLGEHLQYLRGQLLQSRDATSILNGCNSCKLGVPSPILWGQDSILLGGLIWGYNYLYSDNCTLGCKNMLWRI